MRNINKTVWELLLGIVCSGLLLEAVGLLFVRDKLYYSIGVGIGVSLAFYMTFSISASVIKAVDRGENGAKVKMITSYAVRTLVLLAVIAVTGYYKIGSLVGLILGVMTLKVAAYIQPITHKFLTGRKE